MTRYIVVGSSGVPQEVTEAEYVQLMDNRFLTCYTVGIDGSKKIDKLTEESEYDGFPPNCS